MIKRLFLYAVSAFFAFAASAVEVGDYVYTPGGRYKLTALKTSFEIAPDLDGWTSINSNGLLENFQVADGYVSAVSAAYDKGLYKSFELDDDNRTYVLVFDAKANEGAYATTFTPQFLGAGGDHIAHLNVFGTESGEYENTATAAGDYTAQADLKLGFQLTGEYQTYATALTNDGSDLTWFVEISQLLDGISIGNFRLFEAEQVYDNRFLQNKIDYLNAIVSVCDWEGMKKSDAETRLWDFVKAAPGELASMADATTVEEGNKRVAEVNDSVARFYAAFFGDFAADQKMKFQKRGGTGRDIEIGNSNSYYGWTAASAYTYRWYYGRTEDYVLSGNYANNNSYSPNIVITSEQKNLAAGSYIFALDSYMDAQGKKGTLNGHNDGSYNLAYRPALCRGELTLSVLNEEGEEVYTGSTVALDNQTYKTGVVAFNIPEGQDGKYSFRIFANDTYATNDIAKVGGKGVFYDVRIFFKAAGKYNAKQLAYIEKVREQITAMRNAYNLAVSYYTDADGRYYWYKQAVRDTSGLYRENLEFYESLTDDDIINGFDEPASKAAKEAAEAEAGTEFPEWDYNLSYDKYAAGTQSAIDTIMNRGGRPLFRLNERFLAYNQVLLDMLESIDKARVILNTRVFSGRIAYATLESAVGDAEAMFEDYKEDPGTVEDLVDSYIPAVQDITNMMNETMTNFYQSGYNPGEEPVVIRSFDFENAEAFVLDDPATDPGAGSYTDPTGVMTLANLELAANTGLNVNNGYFKDGAWESQGILRIGKGDATIMLDEAEIVSGTDALHVSFDFYFGNLNKCGCGVYFKDTENTNVAGFWGSVYDNTWFTTAYNPFQIDGGKDFSKIGGEGVDKLLAETNKTHFDFYLDYGEKTMFCIVNNGTTKTVNKRYNATMDNDNPVKSLVINSNYSVEARRSAIDNIVIEKITLGAAPQGLKGDANGDGEVGMPDVMFVVNYILGSAPETFNFKNADANLDGEIGMPDVMYIVNFILNGKFPDEE